MNGLLDRAAPAPDIAVGRVREQDRRTFPAWVIWRADSFRATEGLPMTIRRAMALNAVLERCDLIHFPGELIIGSGHGRHTMRGDTERLEDARRTLNAIGARTFTTHADHAAPDYEGLLSEGLPGLRNRVAEAERRHRASHGKVVFLESVRIALEGLERHILRWAEAVEDVGKRTRDPLVALQVSMLRELVQRPPERLWEALQLVYLTHCAFQMDERAAMAIGRADQFFYPFYVRDVEAGRLSRPQAQTLIEHFVAKLADRWDIQNVCVGGLTPDGDDAVNDLSYLFVEAVRKIARPGANLTARISRKTPDAFLAACANCMRGGSGFPAVYNDDVQVPALMAQGYPERDARDYCFVGCIEAFIPGKQAPWADSRFNLLKCVEDVVQGEPASLRTWSDFWDAFARRIHDGVAWHADQVRQAEEAVDRQGDAYTSPLLSALIRDCIMRGLDVNMGGARYPSNHGIAGMGIGSTADALMAVKRFVYDRQEFDLPALRRMLKANFVGYEEERRRLIHDAPKYGNDDEEVDALAVETAALFCREVLSHRTATGGRFWPLMAANIQNVAAGAEVGATPDGRLAGQPVSDAASPTFGRDRNGPTAVIRSVSKVDYSLAPGGNVVNIKLHPTAVAGEQGLRALVSLIRTCFTLGGVQLQFNTISRETLLDAMVHPDEYADLVVRVSGFSAYFTRLDRAVQEDVLARTEHGCIS